MVKASFNVRGLTQFNEIDTVDLISRPCLCQVKPQQIDFLIINCSLPTCCNQNSTAWWPVAATHVSFFLFDKFQAWKSYSKSSTSFSFIGGSGCLIFFLRWTLRAIIDPRQHFAFEVLSDPLTLRTRVQWVWLSTGSREMANMNQWHYVSKSLLWQRGRDARSVYFTPSRRCTCKCRMMRMDPQLRTKCN